MKIKRELLRVFNEYCVCEKCNVVMERDYDVMCRGKKVYTCPVCNEHYYTEEEYPKRVFEKVGSNTPLTGK